MVPQLERARPESRQLWIGGFGYVCAVRRGFEGGMCSYTQDYAYTAETGPASSSSSKAPPNKISAQRSAPAQNANATTPTPQQPALNPAPWSRASCSVDMGRHGTTSKPKLQEKRKRGRRRLARRRFLACMPVRIPLEPQLPCKVLLPSPRRSIHASPQQPHSHTGRSSGCWGAGRGPSIDCKVRPFGSCGRPNPGSIVHGVCVWMTG